MTSNRFIYFILSAFIAGNLLIIFMQYNSAKNIQLLITGNKRILNELRAGNQLRELDNEKLMLKDRILDSFRHGHQLSSEVFRAIMQRRRSGIDVNNSSRKIF